MQAFSLPNPNVVWKFLLNLPIWASRFVHFLFVCLFFCCFTFTLLAHFDLAFFLIYGGVCCCAPASQHDKKKKRDAATSCVRVDVNEMRKLLLSSCFLRYGKAKPMSVAVITSRFSSTSKALIFLFLFLLFSSDNGALQRGSKEVILTCWFRTPRNTHLMSK